MRIKRPWAHGRPVSGEEEVDQVHQADAHHVGAQQQRQGVDAPAGGAGGGLVVASPYSPSLPGAPFLQTQPFLFQPLDLGTGPALVNIHYSQILGQPSLEPQNMSGEGDESPVGARKDLKFSRMCVHDRQRWKCRDCKGSQICVHDRERSKCRDCKGSQICVHDRRRSMCRDCKGSQICVHDRRRSVCKECKGASICIHGRERRKCKECKAIRAGAEAAHASFSSPIPSHDASSAVETGMLISHQQLLEGVTIANVQARQQLASNSSDGGGGAPEQHRAAKRVRLCALHPADTPDPQCAACEGRPAALRYTCVHNRRRSECKECKGTQVCHHDRQRSKCRDCRGSHICVHDRERSKCRDCKGSQICVHDRRRSMCRDCKGSQICVHDRRRSVCKECKGTSICPHSRERRKCKECKAARTMAALAAVVHQELQEMGGEPDEIPAAGLGFAHLGAFPPMALGEALPAGAVRGAAMGHTASASALSTSSSLFPAPSPSASSHTASVFAAPSFAAAGAAAPLKNELDDGGLPPALLLPVRG